MYLLGDISQPTTSPTSTGSPAAAPAALGGLLRSPPPRPLPQVLAAPLCVVLLARAAVIQCTENWLQVQLLPFGLRAKVLQPVLLFCLFSPLQSHKTCPLFVLRALPKSSFRIHAPSQRPTWARPGPHKLWRHATDSVTDTPQGCECTGNEIG